MNNDPLHSPSTAAPDDNPSASLQNRPRKLRWHFLGGSLATFVFCLAAWIKAQSSNPEGDFFSVFVGWDYSGMTPEEELAARMILEPQPYNDALNKMKSEEQRRKEALSAFAVTKPYEYARLYPIYKDAAQLKAEAQAAEAMRDPIAHAEKLRKKKTKEQLRIEEFSAWAITHPKEYAEMIKPLKTAEDMAAENKAAYDIAHPIMKPAPIYKLVPVPEELRKFYPLNKRHYGN